MSQHVLLFHFNSIIQLVSPQERRRYAPLSILLPAKLQTILFNHHLHPQLLLCLLFFFLFLLIACFNTPDGIRKLVSGGPAIGASQEEHYQFYYSCNQNTLRVEQFISCKYRYVHGLRKLVGGVLGRIALSNPFRKITTEPKKTYYFRNQSAELESLLRILWIYILYCSSTWAPRGKFKSSLLPALPL